MSPVPANPVKAALRAGGVAFGSMAFEFDTRGIGRLAAGAGADFLVYDLEHTGWSLETLGRLVAATPDALVPMTRVPTTQGHFISRALDVGALGLMVPMVESAEQAQEIVAAAKYPPVGRRGAAFGIAHDRFVGGAPTDTMERANSETLVIAQIETVGGLEQVDAIAAVDEVDVLWVGHFDLTSSMGIPGQFDHPDYLSAIERVSAATTRAGKAAGFMCGSVEEGRRMLDLGYRAIAYWGDLWLYQSALADGLRRLREPGR